MPRIFYSRFDSKSIGSWCQGSSTKGCSGANCQRFEPRAQASRWQGECSSWRSDASHQRWRQGVGRQNWRSCRSVHGRVASSCSAHQSSTKRKGLFWFPLDVMKCDYFCLFVLFVLFFCFVCLFEFNIGLRGLLYFCLFNFYLFLFACFFGCIY